VTVVLKLGGSVVTHKGERETIDEEALDRAARSVAAAPDDLVLVHGGGSFGHPIADAHGLSRTDGSHDAAAALDVHDAMDLLSDAVVSRLQDRGAAALPVHPLSAGVRDAAGHLDLATAPIEAMLAEGFLPVLHGDVVVHAGRGVTIVSGDELVSVLADVLSADRVGLCSAVPGVLDGAGNVIERVDDLDAVAELLGGAGGTDVTGGMAAKVEALLALDAPASVFGLDGLDAFLAGGSPGTLVGG
jgi:isopentenyl phosphate kinase